MWILFLINHTTICHSAIEDVAKMQHIETERETGQWRADRERERWREPLSPVLRGECGH